VPTACRSRIDGGSLHCCCNHDSSWCGLPQSPVMVAPCRVTAAGLLLKDNWHGEGSMRRSSWHQLVIHDLRLSTLARVPLYVLGSSVVAVGIECPGQLLLSVFSGWSAGRNACSAIQSQVWLPATSSSGSHVLLTASTAMIPLTG
jgi:hypothetical protein